MILFHRAAALSLAVLTLAATLIGAPAQAVPVTVGGTTYDVQFFPDGQSFNDNETALTPPNAPPWWGSLATARDFANAYETQVPTPYPFDDPGVGFDYIFFAHDNPGASVFFAFLRDDGFVDGGSVNELAS